MNLEKKYNEYYTKIINNNIDRIIDAFCIFYGQQYRFIITEKINSITFMWFRHKDLDIFIKMLKRTLKNGRDMEYFLKYKNNEKIGSNKNISSFLTFELESSLNSVSRLIAANVHFYNHLDNNFVETICFPIFIVNDNIMFHEINHVVTKEILMCFNDKMIIKGGLNINNENVLFEELINEITSREICEIFNKNGGSIFDNNIKIGSDYEILFPLINSFYNKYKELIKYAKISLNYNILFKYIDKEVFKTYINLINEVFETIKRSEIKKDTIDLAEEYVQAMEKENVKTLKLV